MLRISRSNVKHPMLTNAVRFGLVSSLSLLALTGLFSIACTSTTSTVTPGGGTPGIDGGPGGDGGDCSATGGTGTITLTVEGLPAGVAARVKIAGTTGAPSEATESETIDDSPSGNYTVSAERVASVDPIVRTLFEPKVDVVSFCLGATQTQAVKVTYTAIPSSNKLWAANANNAAGQLLGFGGATLAATGTPAATVAAKAPAGGALAFDKDGNLWAIGATLAEPPLVRWGAADLGASGTKTPDRLIDMDIPCLPRLSAIAFDPSGNLWATSICSDKVFRFSPGSLAASGKVTPGADDIFTGTEAPHGIAFDAAGNMWVSDATSLHSFPAANLAAGQPHTPALTIHPKQENTALLEPGPLAFDKDGNLWAMNFGGNVLFKLTPADLAAGASADKDVIPSIQITVDVGALLEGMAIDEGGGIWMTYSQGKIARLAPGQLATSSGAGAPTIPSTIITSADIGSTGALAFFPAPANLPLYSKF
jgi:hypothetical protein